MMALSSSNNGEIFGIRTSQISPYFHVLFNLVIMSLFLAFSWYIYIGGVGGLTEHGAHVIPIGVSLDIPLNISGGEANIACKIKFFMDTLFSCAFQSCAPIVA